MCSGAEAVQLHIQKSQRHIQPARAYIEPSQLEIKGGTARGFFIKGLIFKHPRQPWNVIQNLCNLRTGIRLRSLRIGSLIDAGKKTRSRDGFPRGDITVQLWKTLKHVRPHPPRINVLYARVKSGRDTVLASVYIAHVTVTELEWPRHLEAAAEQRPEIVDSVFLFFENEPLSEARPVYGQTNSEKIGGDNVPSKIVDCKRVRQRLTRSNKAISRHSSRQLS